MYKYTGDFEYLAQLGFIKDAFDTYWFLPTKPMNKYMNPLTVNIKDRVVEFTVCEQLEIIKNYLQLV